MSFSQPPRRTTRRMVTVTSQQSTVGGGSTARAVVDEPAPTTKMTSQKLSGRSERQAPQRNTLFLPSKNVASTSLLSPQPLLLLSKKPIRSVPIDDNNDDVPQQTMLVHPTPQSEIREPTENRDDARIKELEHQCMQYKTQLNTEQQQHRQHRLVSRFAMRWRLLHVKNRAHRDSVAWQANMTQLQNTCATLREDLTKAQAEVARVQHEHQCSLQQASELATLRLELSQEKTARKTEQLQLAAVNKELADVKAEVVSLRLKSQVGTFTDTKKRPALIPTNVPRTMSGTKRACMTPNSTSEESFGSFIIPVDEAPPSPVFHQAPARGIPSSTMGVPRPSFIRHNQNTSIVTGGIVAAPIIGSLASGVPRKSFFRQSKPGGTTSTLNLPLQVPSVVVEEDGNNDMAGDQW